MALPTLFVTLAGHVVTNVVTLVDKSPEPEDVKAGWTAFALFILLALAVAFLGFSLVKQLRKAQAAKDAGVYDEPADTPAEPADTPAVPEDDQRS